MKLIISFVGLLVAVLLISTAVIFGHQPKPTGTKAVPVKRGPIIHPYGGELVFKTPEGKTFTLKEFKRICNKGLTSILDNQLIWMSEKGGKYVIFAAAVHGFGFALSHDFSRLSSISNSGGCINSRIENGRIGFVAYPIDKLPLGAIVNDRMVLFQPGKSRMSFTTKDLK